jgi:hypothetical protein
MNHTTVATVVGMLAIAAVKEGEEEQLNKRYSIADSFYIY